MSLKGLWSKLFGKNSTLVGSPPMSIGLTSTPAGVPLSAVALKQRPRVARDSRLSDHVLSIDSLSFIGKASQSSNKRWVVGATDRQPGMNSRVDHRDGSVILLDYQADRVLLRVSNLYRPMESAVADNGAFVVCDANFGNQLGSDVLAFDAIQKKVLSRSYSANVYNLAISKCGRYVVVQTANAPNDDGSVLELFDLRTEKALFSRQPQTGWADKYAFTVGDDGVLKRLSVIHRDTGRFSYSPDGEFLDQTAYRKARLFGGSPEMRIYGAKDELKADPTNRALAEELLASLDAALKELDHSRADFVATGLRAKGEALELLGRTGEAISSYEQALTVNPKVGVATRLATLKKKC